MTVQIVCGRTPIAVSRSLGNPFYLANQKRAPDITIIAVLMILFGLAEVVTGFTHTFSRVTTVAIMLNFSGGTLSSSAPPYSSSAGVIVNLWAIL